MEFAPSGPVDRLFDPPPFVTAPVEIPQLEALAEPPGFKIKGWHFVAGGAVLALVIVAIWKIKEYQKNKKLELTQI